jgi:hypothetical protein
MLEVWDTSVLSRLVQTGFETAVVYPAKKITAVLNRPFEKVHLRTQAVVRCEHDPSAVQAVLDLIKIDHLRGAEHESSAVDVDHC